MTVAELIKLLQEVDDQDAVVTLDDTGGADLVDEGNIVFTAGAGTLGGPDAPGAEYGANGAAFSAGTVVLTGE